LAPVLQQSSNRKSSSAGQQRARSSSSSSCTVVARASDAAAAATAATTTTNTSAAQSFEIGTAGARGSLKFDLAPIPGRRDGYAVVCVEVAPGSEAAEAGIRVGMRLTAISDPIRRDGVWPVQERPSLKNIRELLRMRCADTITLEFAPWDGPVPLPRPAADGTFAVASAGSTMSSSSDGEGSAMSSGDEAAGAVSPLMSAGSSGGESIGDRLARRYADAAAAGGTKTALQARQQRRREAMAQSEARDDRKFLAGLALAFIAPPLVILAVR
jgi:hypothetical protein